VGSGGAARSFRYKGGRDQETGFSPQPLADNAGALLAIGWPRFWKDVVRNIFGLDAERVLDGLGGVIAVVGVDRLSSRLAMVRLTELFESPPLRA
jgi:hypothetical protein